MQANFLKMAENALDYGVMGILTLMSIVTVWLFIERMMFFSSVDVQSY